MSTKLEKIHQKDAHQLDKLKKQQSRKTYAGYMLIMMSLLSIVRCLDEFASSVGGSIQSWLVNEFFVKDLGKTYAEGLSSWSMITTAMMVFTIMAVFYLALSDRFGRKKILVISVIGMGVGMLICSQSTSLITYLIGSALITFFVATDVHGIYVMEIAPVNKRATFLQTTAVFGQVGVLLVAVSRSVYTVDEVLNWRLLYLIPGLAGLTAGILLMISGRETDVFLKQRIAWLSKPYEQRKAEAAAARQAKSHEARKTGIGSAFRYIFTHRQVRNNLLATIPQLLAVMAFVGYYESIMTTSGLSTSQVNQALLVYPLSGMAVALLTGFFSDKFGRRPTTILTSVVALASLIGFVVAARSNASPIIVGLLYGFENGAFFRYGDTLGLQRLESVPTNIRASVQSAFGLIATVVATTAGITLSILVASVEVGTLCLTWGGILIGISALLNFLLVKETKGVHLEDIT